MSSPNLSLDDVQDVAGPIEEGRTLEILLEDGRVLVARIRQVQSGPYSCPDDDCFRRFDSPRAVKTHVGKFHKELVAKECPECHRVFHPTPRSQKYCSTDCRDAGTKNRTTLFCENCDRSFEVKASHADERKNCCRECKNESNREIRTCPTCGDQFEVYPSEPQTYCSRECYRDRTPTDSREERTCPECDDVFEVYPSEDQRFCSRQCYAASRWVTKTCPMCGRAFESKKQESLSKEHCSQWCMYERRRTDSRPNRPDKLLLELGREDHEPEAIIGRASAHLGPEWDRDDVAAFYWLYEYRDFRRAAAEADVSPERVLEVEARAVGANGVDGGELLDLLEEAETRLEIQNALRVDRQDVKQFIAWIGLDETFQGRMEDLIQNLKQQTAAESWPGGPV